MTHPSIQGLREAVTTALMTHHLDGRNYDQGAGCVCGAILPVVGDEVQIASHVTESITAAQAAYLTEHGVGWFGEGLVRAPERDGRSVTPRDVPGLDKLYERAKREPIEVDLSDWSDEYVAGFLAGQAQVVAMLPEPLTFLVPVPQDGE